MSKVWLITGCSSGLGREIALAAAKRGDTVVATARDISKMEDFDEKIIRKRLDVQDDDEQMKRTISEVIKQVGRIDILVNNAGYLLDGAIEECSTEETQQMFEVNVFGQLTVIRAVAPYMRAQNSGTIANLGSIAGWFGMASAGLYCATKAAIAMYSEALHIELAPFNIEVTCIEPGYFRTNFLAADGCRKGSKNRISSISAAAETRAMLDTVNKKQPGDPVKGASVIVQALTKSGVCEGRKLPLRMLLGPDAVKMAKDALARNKQELDDWEAIVSTTNHDDVK